MRGLPTEQHLLLLLFTRNLEINGVWPYPLRKQAHTPLSISRGLWDSDTPLRPFADAAGR